MQCTRRKFVSLICSISAALLCPLRVLAAQWNAKAFDETRFADSLKSVGVRELIESSQIQLKTPEIAENGAIVPIQVISEIPNTEKVFVFAEKNPQPLVSTFDFVGNVEPFFATRIKMGESAKVHVVVLAQGKHYVISREVKVTIGGCGEDA
ncbi:MAG: thiosulfate oxidation carrier protein SoxY [Burkholderiales bacterium]|nr:thiosulfate oxidation carrier protein SoxY [Burkholderiales bacterium]